MMARSRRAFLVLPVQVPISAVTSASVNGSTVLLCATGRRSPSIGLEAIRSSAHSHLTNTDRPTKYDR